MIVKCLYIRNKKLRAFTIPELVVSLLLISVLFMTGFAIYMIMQKQANNLTAKNNFYTDYFITKSVLQRDFSEPGIITVSGDRRIVQIKAERNDSTTSQVTLLFDSAYILRTQGDQIDTLLPGAVIEQTHFLQDTLALVDFIKIRSAYNKKNIFTYLEKDYSAAELLLGTNNKLASE